MTVRSLEWLLPLARRAGACIRAVCSIEAMVPDAERVLAPVDANLEINVIELDVSELIVQGEY
jgi:hypothetical protein